MEGGGGGVAKPIIELGPLSTNSLEKYPHCTNEMIKSIKDLGLFSGSCIKEFAFNPILLGVFGSYKARGWGGKFAPTP